MQHDAVVFPVSEPDDPVDVFVREVDPAREGCMPVDHKNLPVIAVIQEDRRRRDKPVEHDTLDPKGAHFFEVAHRKGADRTDVVVYEADIHALPNLLFQDLQNAVPHLAFCDDEVLDEDKVLCLLKLLLHPRVHLLTRRKEDRLRVVIGRKAAVSAEIAALPVRVLVRLPETHRHRILLLHQRFAEFDCAFIASTDLPGHAGLSHDVVQYNAYNGNRQNQDGPQKLVGRIHPIVQNPEYKNHCEQLDPEIDVSVLCSQFKDNVDKQPDLKKNRSQHNRQSAKNRFQKPFHRCIPLLSSGTCRMPLV